MNKKHISCSCECGQVQFKIVGTPITRMACHCQICQAFNQAAYADITIFRTKDIIIDDIKQVSFRKYKAPPAIQRGKCQKCEKPVLELLDLPLVPGLTIIPSERIPYGPMLPKLSMHIFYHRREKDIEDDLPKISGAIGSQLATLKAIFPNLALKFINNT